MDWIGIDERLPERFKPVEVKFTYEPAGEFTSVCWRDEDEWWLDAARYISSEGATAVAWRPLLQKQGMKIQYEVIPDKGVYLVRRWAERGVRTWTRYVKRYTTEVAAQRVTAVLNWASPVELDINEEIDEAAAGRLYSVLLDGNPMDDGLSVYTNWWHYIVVESVLLLNAGREYNKGTRKS